MDEIIRTAPTAEYGKDIMRFRAELLEANDSDRFAGCGSLQKYETIEEWLKWIADHAGEACCPPGYSLRHIHRCPHLR